MFLHPSQSVLPIYACGEKNFSDHCIDFSVQIMFCSAGFSDLHYLSEQAMPQSTVSATDVK